VERAWAAIRDAAASLRGAGAAPTLASLRAAMDAADQTCPYSALLRDAGADVESTIKR
jgi:hypothetical protein